MSASRCATCGTPVQQSTAEQYRSAQVADASVEWGNEGRICD